MDLVIQCITKKYAKFSTRASRTEFWLFTLFYCIAAVGLSVIDLMVGTWDAESGVGVFSGIFLLVTFIPNLAVSVRRLHDTNRRGWWLLLYFLPLIGFIWIIVLYCLEGSDGENRFGADPLTNNAEGIISSTTGTAPPNTAEPRNNHSTLLLILVGVTLWTVVWKTISAPFTIPLGIDSSCIAIFTYYGWAIIPAIFCLLNDTITISNELLAIFLLINDFIILILHVIIFIFVLKIHRGKSR